MVLAIYLILVIFVLFGLIYLSFKNSYRLWDKCKVPHLSPKFPFGNFKDATKDIHMAIVCQRLYEQLKEQGEYAGVYMFKKPTLLVTGPEFAKIILDRDFDTFPDRGLYYNKKSDPLSRNLYFHEGNDWKILKHKLNPAFTDGKLKMIFHTLEDATNDLIDRINIAINNDIDAKELMMCFIADVSSSCVFGVDRDSINISSAKLRKAERNVMNFSKTKMFMITLAGLFRDLARQIGFRVFDSDANDFFSEVVHKIVGFRKENNVHRHDLIQLMIELMRQDYESNEGLTVDEIVPNAFIFFFMEFGTCYSTLTYALYHLALDEQIQNDARNEIESTIKKFDGKLTYDGLNEMSLIDRILSETLRFYPPFFNLHRISNKKYILPNGSEIPKGTNVIIPVFAIHHDERIYPEPEKFDPNRFLDDNKSKRHPYTYLPFGEGPRICIGRKLAQVQIKLALANIIRNFHVTTTPNTINPLLSIDNNAMTFIPRDQVWLKFDKVTIK